MTTGAYKNIYLIFPSFHQKIFLQLNLSKLNFTALEPGYVFSH
jgi:hypothetical protein